MLEPARTPGPPMQRGANEVKPVGEMETLLPSRIPPRFGNDNLGRLELAFVLSTTHLLSYTTVIFDLLHHRHQGVSNLLGRDADAQ